MYFEFVQFIIKKTNIYEYVGKLLPKKKSIDTFCAYYYII